MSLVHIVYAHPGGPGQTRAVLDAFVAGLTAAGHAHTLSDLYAKGFRPELSAAELARESGRAPGAPVPEDVAAEHALLAAAEVWAFVYPVWWADCPAILKGWFDRVWTVGDAYKPVRLTARRALVLCTAGYDAEKLTASGVLPAMRTVMLTDRLGDRAPDKDLHVCDPDLARSLGASI
ncbi:flavodoxin family protein [Actinorhabdospora filicis]|uniref:Flavodoxin family protein n=1 Tax=Actinorhabdospora filicis TaxID=1785913 RepID=A0A9W6SPN5_9ACTN|nr:NAD(P)H-dependent oxidoreductase [Actinorhabdospora filicis]GLZ80680.1 flavodoxin family protein [Actinorhabdospora filicis]